MGGVDRSLKGQYSLESHEDARRMRALEDKQDSLLHELDQLKVSKNSRHGSASSRGSARKVGKKRMIIDTAKLDDEDDDKK